MALSAVTSRVQQGDAGRFVDFLKVFIPLCRPKSDVKICLSIGELKFVFEKIIQVTFS